MPSGLMWEASLRILAVAAVGGLYVSIRRPGAAMRHAVWTAVCVTMLLLPLLLAAGPKWAIEYPAAVLPPPQEVAPGITVSVSSLRVLTPPAPRRVDWLPYAYFAGLAFFLLRLTAGWIGVRLFLRGARPLPDLDAFEVARLSVPVTILNRVLLPSGWREWESWQLHTVLAHERAHVERRDWLFAQLAQLNRAIFWFHPLAWVLERAVAHAAEHACDDAACVHAPDTSSYAAMLVDFASARPGASRIAIAMARPSGLATRVERLLLPVERVPARVSRTIVAAIVALVLPAGVVTFVPRNVIGQTTQSQRNSVMPDIATIQDGLRTNPDDIQTRVMLAIALRGQNRLNEAVDQAVWMIEHHPESSLGATLIQGGLSPLEDRRMQEAWEQAVQRQSGNGIVLLNAVQFWQRRDLSRSDELLARAVALLPGEERTEQVRGSVYAGIVMGTGPGGSPALTERVRRELETTNNARLVGFTGLNLQRALPFRGGSPADAGKTRAELAGKYLTRAQQLDPGNPRWSDRSVPPPPPPSLAADAPAYVGRLLESPTPEYPPLALQARIQGTVKFRAQIGADGAVTGLTLVSGHPLLVAPAQEAARKYKYQPAAPGVVTLAVPFQLPQPGVLPQAAQSRQSQQEELTALAREVARQAAQDAPAYTGNLVYKLEPEYPPLARQARIEGTVRLRVGIGADGKVTAITLISGHPLLAQAAQEAVRAYRYQPAAPGAVTVEVPFRLEQ